MRIPGHRIALAGILLMALALRLWSWVGPELTDEMRYAAVAQNMAHGYLPSGPTEWFGTRVVLLAPVALLFKLFGAGDPTLAVWPLIGSLGAVAVTYLLGRDLADRRVGLVAAGLVAVAPIEVRVGMFLRPDAIMPAFIALAVWLALRAGLSEERTAAWAAGSGAALALGWSVRETALLMAPVVVMAAWPAIRRALLPGVLGALSVPLVTCIVWALAGGSFLAPLRSAGSELQYRNPIDAWSFHDAYIGQLWNGAFATGSLLFLALPVMIATLAIHWFRHERRAILPVVWLAWGYAYLEFGTLVNLTKPYRYLTLVVIPAALLVALVFEGRHSWVPIATAAIISTLVLAGMPFRAYRADDTLLFSRVSSKLAKLPSGTVATESYTWWKKLTIYHATTRLSVPRARDPAFSTPQQIAASRRLVPLPSVTDATYLVTGPVHPRSTWPTNWSEYRREVPSPDGLELLADLGQGRIWRLPAPTSP